MQLELRLSNEPRTLPGVRAFTRETLRQLPLPTADAEQLEELVHGAVAHAVAHAYPAGEEGSIQLSIRESHGKLELLIRDFGLPQDIASLEQQLHEPNSVNKLLGSHATAAADELHWLNFGREGKALQILKWLHTTSITAQVDAAALQSFHDNAPLAPQQQYTVRRMRASEAVQVSQLMYRAYGNSYFNADVYYPERVAAQDAHGAVLSFVAVAQDGTLAGHYALELNQSGPVAETGQAVVDPAHRGRGLLDLMHAAVMAEAQRLDLIGTYGDAVAVHTLTQKSNVTHGGHLSAVELGISPRTEKFRNLAEQLPQRVTCLLYFHWLKAPAMRTVFVPERHQGVVAELYKNLQCPVVVGTTNDASPTETHGTLTVQFEGDAARAFIRAETLAADTLPAIRHAKRELVERSHAEVVFVELPMANAGVVRIAEELESDGFGFAGLAPHFSKQGDLLRLVYLVEPMAREPIKTFEDFAGRLVDYVLGEQQRVRASM